MRLHRTNCLLRTVSECVGNNLRDLNLKLNPMNVKRMNLLSSIFGGIRTLSISNPYYAKCENIDFNELCPMLERFSVRGDVPILAFCNKPWPSLKSLTIVDNYSLIESNLGKFVDENRQLEHIEFGLHETDWDVNETDMALITIINTCLGLQSLVVHGKSPSVDIIGRMKGLAALKKLHIENLPTDGAAGIFNDLSKITSLQ